MKTKPLKLVCDSQIPLTLELFSENAHIVQKKGSEIGREDCLDADILLTRTITPINEALLHGTAVKFVGSATAGLDHIDTTYLKKANITLASAKGANAQSVAQYVMSCVAHFYQQGLFQSPSKRAAVIGVGCCGSLVAQYLKAQGFELLLNDPLRSEQEANFHSTPLSEFRNLDLICVHTPLTVSGKYPSYHLIDETFLKQQKPGCVFINAGRGEVADTQALLDAKSLKIGLDVWENEPNISLELLSKVVIATPHIAGYSEQAKARATHQLYEQARVVFGWPEKKLTTASSQQDHRPWDVKALEAFDPMHATTTMRHALLKEEGDLSNAFETLRKSYLSRQEYE